MQNDPVVNYSTNAAKPQAGQYPTAYRLPTDDITDSRVWATWYREALGWHVIPAHGIYRFGLERVGCGCGNTACDKPGKHPKDKWGDGLTRGVSRTDNLALVTGRISGVVVADIDPRHGGALDTLWALGWPQNTVVSRSGGGGWHVYAQCPPDGLRSMDAYALGIELKADGKYVIVAPSLHIARRRYRWIHGHAPWDCSPAPLPDAILTDLASRAPARTVGEAPPDRDDPNALVYSLAETTRIATALIRKAVRMAEDGYGRNNAGFWLGRQLDSLGLTRRAIAKLAEVYWEGLGDLRG